MAQTTTQTVYDTFESIESFDEAIEMLAGIDLNTEDQPWCFTQRFEHIRDKEDPFALARRIALAFKATSGTIIIEAESSFCTGKMMTIMDEFEMAEGHRMVSNWLLKRAFRQEGFLYARECSNARLKELYKRAGY